MARAGVTRLYELIRQFHPANVYNMGETALFNRALPCTSRCLVKSPAIKQSKARLTMVVTGNTDGTANLPFYPLACLVCQAPASVDYVGATRCWMTVVAFQTGSATSTGAWLQSGGKYCCS
ncbi:hypothetical protein PybrP1_012935 [[Pythium] brassicae (nom. inval.)]|nr:hypothetical protein PybrP1_012935 [[Pythium] brassicae (nom. inval.)]